MRIVNCEQGSPEWFSERLGRPTASKFKEIITTAGVRSKSREKYLYQVAGEVVTGQREKTYINAAMVRGTELEPDSRRLFELITDLTVEQVGLCITDDNIASCSPDGLMGDDMGYETKSPSMAVHIDYLLRGKLPTEYFQQVQGSMYVTGRKQWYFMSYYPGLKPLILLCERDEGFIERLHEELVTFNADLQKVVEKIRS